MAKKTFNASDVLADVGGLLYGPSDMKEKLASMLGVPPRVIHDTLRGHGGLTMKRLTELAEARSVEAKLLRDVLHYCGT